MVSSDAPNCGMMRCELPVAQHGETVAEPENLIKAVGHVKNDSAARFEAGNERKQDFAFLR